MKNSILLLFLIFSFYSLHAQEIEVTGTIYLDQNTNGHWDRSEPGIRNVLVSDGQQLVRTNRRGKFKITTMPGAQVFPILPSGYSHDKPVWWESVDDHAGSVKSVQLDFGLRAIPQESEFKALVIGDIQVNDTEELAYADRTILSELRARNDYDFSIFMGDLVNDEPSLLPILSEMINGLDKPAYAVYGNHDRNAALLHEKQQWDYNKAFGPETYAFYRNEVLFVVLNSLIPKGKFGYSEVYPEKDLVFLKNLLAHKADNQLLAINQHVPLGMIENKEALLGLIDKEKQVLLLAGHTHTVYQNFREREDLPDIHELTAGAVSGHWWTGEKDWQGVPVALMRDGTPRGYFELDFHREENNRTSYQIRYKGVGLDPDIQLSIWLGESGTEVNNTIDPDNPVFYVNFYAGSRKSQVAFRIDNGPWIRMDQKRMPDPYVSRIRLLQREDLMPNGVSRRSPYRNQSSSHIFEGIVPDDLVEGSHYLEVQATDPYGTAHQEGRWFWVER